MKTTTLLGHACAIGLFASVSISAATSLSVDASVTAKKISPYIYGKNHGIANTTGTTTHADTIQRYKDAGFNIIRLNNGNNATKYNWEKRMSSHPDWYNNVYEYSNNWDLMAQEMSSKLPNVQGLFALSLLGWVANDAATNFNATLYNGDQWTTDAQKNWAGITTPITAAGQKPTGTADPLLYLKKQTLDENLGIVDHFFNASTATPAGLGLSKNQFLYWNMDNEADIWHYTHDDVMPDTMSAEEFIQIYVAMAKKARTKFPEIKLVGPVATNEWQWFNWHNAPITVGTTKYSFVEYFLKRVAEEQASSGLRLLDVVDYHFYPEYNTASDKAKILQLHRIWFDESYVYPKANGIKSVYANETKEYIFKRTRAWLDQYFPANHGITLGITECGAIDGAKTDAPVIAAWYASQLGEFASAGDVEVFTPWTQYQGMFEAVHLFTRYAKTHSLPAQNSADNLISAYSTLNSNKDSMTVILVNRDLSNEQTITVNLANFAHGASWAPTFDLAYLEGETFVSEANNGIYKNAVDVASGAFTITVPKVSVTAVVLSKATNAAAKPTFTARVTPSSSSTGGSSASGTATVVWDYTTGQQVKQASGTLGGWWYTYADPLSTLVWNSTSIATDKNIHVTFTGVTNATQNYNYAGLGFNWANTVKGQPLVTVDLSAYSQICVEYKSDLGFQAMISQPSLTDAAKAQSFGTGLDAIPASATPTTQCLPWADFGAGTALNLTKQNSFQVQVNGTADFTIYKVYLTTGSSKIQTNKVMPVHFLAQVVGAQLMLTLPQATQSEARLLDLHGKLVQSWKLNGTQNQYALSLAQIQRGRYIVQIQGMGARSIVLLK